MIFGKEVNVKTADSKKEIAAILSKKAKGFVLYGEADKKGKPTGVGIHNTGMEAQDIALTLALYAENQGISLQLAKAMLAVRLYEKTGGSSIGDLLGTDIGGCGKCDACKARAKSEKKGAKKSVKKVAKKK